MQHSARKISAATHRRSCRASLPDPREKQAIISRSLSRHAIRAIAVFPGLYLSNQRFYCQRWMDRGDGRESARRFPLFTVENLPARTLQEAKEALEIKRHDGREDKLPTLGRKPNFNDYCETHLTKARVQRKRSETVQTEEQAIRQWRSHLGHVRRPNCDADDSKLCRQAFAWRLAQETQSPLLLH